MVFAFFKGITAQSSDASIILDPKDYIGSNLPQAEREVFKKDIGLLFSEPTKGLEKAVMDSYKEKIARYPIFWSEPGYSFRTLSPVHLLALVSGLEGNLSIYDGGCGDGYLSLLMASQGNTLECVDAFPKQCQEYYNTILSKNYGYFLKEKLDIYVGDFTASLKKLHGGKSDLDMILSFNTLHFLAPREVSNYLSIAYSALKKGGSIIGMANSCYRGESGLMASTAQGPKNYTRLYAEFSEFQRDTRGSLFPGYIAETIPTKFHGNYNHSTDSDFPLKKAVFSNADSIKPSIYYKGANEFNQIKPQLTIPSNPLVNPLVESKEIDDSALAISHSFFKETIERELKSAGFPQVSVFYIDEKTNKVFKDFDISHYTPFTQNKIKNQTWYKEYKKRLYTTKLVVGFSATK